MSISADIQGDRDLSLKYKSIGMLEYMREQKKLDEQGSFKEKAKPGSQLNEPKTPEENKGEEEEEKPPSNEMDSAPGFFGTRLTQNEEDIIYTELGEYLLDKYLCDLSKKSLSFVSDQ